MEGGKQRGREGKVVEREGARSPAESDKPEGSDSGSAGQLI